MSYDLFFIDTFGHVSGGKVVAAADDLTALEAARTVALGQGMLEVWTSERFVARVSRDGICRT
jgi:hypothetical protein